MKYIGNIQSQANAEVFAVASGALPDGKPVVVNSNGTVSVIAATPDTFNGVNAVNTDSFYRTATTFDSNSNRVVIAYGDGADSNKGKAIVGTVASGTISFGTPVVFNNAVTGSNINGITATFDSNSNKVVIAYRDNGNSNYGTAIVGTVDSSDNSISFGSEAVFSSALTYHLSSTFDSNSNKVVIAYRGSNDDGYGIVGTVSGTSISFGSAAEFSGNNDIEYTATTFDSNSNKVVIAYNDDGNSGRGTAVVGTVSSTSISFGSVVVFSGTNVATYEGITFDTSNNKVVISYRDESTDYGTAVVGTVSGTSISFGTPVVFRSANSAQMTSGTIFDTATGKVIISYLQGNHGEVVVGTVSGTSISFDTAQDSGADNNISAAYDSNASAMVLAARTEIDGAAKARVVVFSPAGTNLTTENFLGFTGGDVTYDIASETLGSASVFESASTSAISATFDSNLNKIVIVYADGGNSNFATAVVGTVSGTSISFGTPVVFDSGDAGVLAATFDSSSNKVVVVFKANSDSDKGKAIVGTVSGTGISFGSVVVFESSAIGNGLSATFDTNSNRVVIAYLLASNSHGKSIVGTVSGTSISFGSTVTFESASTGLGMGNITFDSSNNKVVIAYVDGGDSSKGKAIVGTVSNTSISFGTAAVFETGSTADTAITFDASNNKVVVAFRDAGDSNKGKSAVGTVSGTGISFGTAVIFKATQVRKMFLSYNSAAAKIVLLFHDYAATGHGQYIVGTVSGTSISFSSVSTFNATDTADAFITYDSNSKVNVIAYKDESNSNHGTAKVYQAGYDNTVRGEVADGKTATIQVGGSINTQQNALTAGQQYFVQTDGTIGTTAASPSVIAGTAVSATDLIVKG